MMYNSTQDVNNVVTPAEAIARGIAQDGGLFVPREFPQYSLEELAFLCRVSYNDRAKKVMGDYLTDFKASEIAECVDAAYTEEKFGSTQPAPIKTIVYNNNEINVLELFHGPTSAFKDMALQILPHLLTKSLEKVYRGKKAVILVATSGDTGKAALEGFKDVENTKIIVFYPKDGVSVTQKLQMVTQEGANVSVAAIMGNFDDAQTGVKQIFADKKAVESLRENNMIFSSANSINWGRLLPQIVYYISGYCELVNLQKVKLGETINIVVPTGNFGNILAAYYAKKMGLPVHKLICASNTNNVLSLFFKTGSYSRDIRLINTISPSMDILVSSNFERLIYDNFLIIDKDNSAVKTREYAQKIKTGLTYYMEDEPHKNLIQNFSSGYCTEDETKETIANLYVQQKYLCDTHTAVAVNVYDKYIKETKDQHPVLLASTASPYKFSKAVLESVIGEKQNGDEFDLLNRLSNVEGADKVPKGLLELKEKEVRFNTVLEVSQMADFVLESARFL